MPVAQRRPGMGGVPAGIEHEDLATQGRRLRHQGEHPGFLDILVQRVPGVELHRHRAAGVRTAGAAPVVQAPGGGIQAAGVVAQQHRRQREFCAGPQRMGEPPIVQPARQRGGSGTQTRFQRPVAGPQQLAQIHAPRRFQRKPGLELEAGLARPAVQHQGSVAALMHHRLRLGPPGAGQRMGGAHLPAQGQPDAERAGDLDWRGTGAAVMSQCRRAQQHAGGGIDGKAHLAFQRRLLCHQDDCQYLGVVHVPAMQPPGDADRARADLDHCRQPGVELHVVLAPVGPERRRRCCVVRAEFVAHQRAGLHPDAEANSLPGQGPSGACGVVAQDRYGDGVSAPWGTAPKLGGVGRPGQGGSRNDFLDAGGVACRISGAGYSRTISVKISFYLRIAKIRG